jgi:hypothetical protein
MSERFETTCRSLLRRMVARGGPAWFSSQCCRARPPAGLPPAKCYACLFRCSRHPNVNPSPRWLVGPCYVGNFCRPLWAPELPVRFSFLSGRWGVSSSGLLPAEACSGVGSGDLFRPSRSPFLFFLGARGAACFVGALLRSCLPPAGWAVVPVGVSRFLRRPPLRP